MKAKFLPLLLLTVLLQVSMFSFANEMTTARIDVYKRQCLACKWMINVVKKGKLIYFAIYCAIAGLVTIILS